MSTRSLPVLPLTLTLSLSLTLTLADARTAQFLRVLLSHTEASVRARLRGHDKAGLDEQGRDHRPGEEDTERFRF
jgi:hypothetical protein